MPPVDEPKAIYLDMNDAQGNPVMVFSTTGELKTAGEFAKVLSAHNAQKPLPAGFIVEKAKVGEGGEVTPETFQGRARLGFEQGPGTFGRETLPQIGRAIGTASGVSPLLALAERAGILPKGSGTAARQTLGTGGEETGRFIGKQIDEPAEVGMAGGAALASPLMLPVTAASGAMPKASSIAFNTILGALSGGAGASVGRVVTGEDIEPERAQQDFAIAAAGGATQLVTHFISKHISGDMQEKVAKGVIDTFKKRFPSIGTRDDVLDIAMSSPDNLNKLAQQLGGGLMDTVEKESKRLLDDVYNILPSTPTVGQKVSLNGYARRLVEAQKKRVNAIGNDIDYSTAKDAVMAKGEEFVDEIAKLYSPKVKNIEPTKVRVAQAINNFRDSFTNVEDGAKVLHLIKLSGGDLNKFAQMIRGDYQAIPGSTKEEIGRILGQGRSLTQMPQPKAEPEPPTGIAKTVIDLVQHLPFAKQIGNLSTAAKRQPVPWPSPGQVLSPRGTSPKVMSPGSIPMAPLVNFGAQEAGQTAIRSFLEGGKE